MADARIDSLRKSARHRRLVLKVSRRRKPGGDFGRMGLVDGEGGAVMGVGDDGLTASADEVEAYLRTLGRADWKTSAGTARRVTPEPTAEADRVEVPAPAANDDTPPVRKKTKPPKPKSVPAAKALPKLEPEPAAKAPPEPEREPEAAAKAPPKPESAPRPKAPPKPKAKARFKPDIANLFARLPPARREEAFTTLLEASGVRVERIVSRGQVTPDDEPMIQAAREWVILLAGEARLRIADSDEVTLRPGDHLTIAAEQPHWVTYTSRDEAAVWLAVHVEE